ncbi:ImmA/IrrE family metallo-endopeptidase [Gaoshiqia sp. Z1-71]|uniref:ImmA/IrrE family metallo-endopeptidase n=1 Tax=Gaoshiqia hydrogeniformans TaxID=3290090 RepID=UPI003BF793A9
MSPNLQLQKDLLSPPGDTIQETIDALGMSQAELAERIGRPKEKLNDIIKGRDPITLKTAMMLERVLGIPADFWIEREREYRLELAKIEQQEFLESCIGWLEQFPIRELKKMGYLPDTREKTELADSLLKLHGVASPAEWEAIYLKDSVSAAFKISLASTQSPHAISTWLRIGEHKSFQQKLPDFDKIAFRKALTEVKELLNTQSADFKEQLQGICARCGVAVLYTPCLPKAPISGATWWKGRNPIIQLSGRYKTNDSFWFAFYHEAGHILQHGKKEVFLENLEGSPIDQEKEDEANQFAQKYLFPKEAFDGLVEIFDISSEDILIYARRYKTHPAIIVGQLQHAGVIGYQQFNHFKISIDLVN